MLTWLEPLIKWIGLVREPQVTSKKISISPSTLSEKAMETDSSTLSWNPKENCYAEKEEITGCTFPAMNTRSLPMFLVSNGALPYCSVIAWGQKYLPYLKLKATSLSTQKHKDEFNSSYV